MRGQDAAIGLFHLNHQGNRSIGLLWFLWWFLRDLKGKTVIAEKLPVVDK